VVHRFERAARRSLKALWDRRSSLNLVGSTIHTQTGRWLQTHSGIGAGIDSFYEYLLKAYIMFGDEEMLEWFNAAYAAVQDHTLWGPWNVEVSMARGKWQPHSFRISALQVRHRYS
jgi:mannosidase alpha-like ER degradation enhancer 1